MKCEAVINKDIVVPYPNEQGWTSIDRECGAEMEKIGNPITNISSRGDGSVDVLTSTLYQCKSCKTIKLA